jgi:hypothetical protein
MPTTLPDQAEAAYGMMRIMTVVKTDLRKMFLDESIILIYSSYGEFFRWVKKQRYVAYIKFDMGFDNGMISAFIQHATAF